MILDEKIKQKIQEAYDAYCVHLGLRGIDFEIVFFEFQDWTNNPEPVELHRETTPFYAKMIRLIEARVGDADVGDIVVRHLDEILFMLFHQSGEVRWAEGNRFQDDVKEDKKDSEGREQIH